MDRRAALAQRFRDFEQTATSRAPLYARLSAAIADDADLLALLDDAPTEQQLPVLLFAAVHLLVLEGLGGALTRFYPSVDLAGQGIEPTGADVDPASPGTDSATSADDDPFPAFRQVALEHAERVRELTATRQTQTNEIGRCALYLPALDAVAADTGPLALVDVGTSAGLNLLLPRYGFDYGEHGVIAGTSDIMLPCALRGNAPIGFSTPLKVPDIAAAVGIDASPVDLLDDEAVRWLEACVWPEMTERFSRLRSAVALARQRLPEVLAGDAVDDIAPLVERMRCHGHPLVLTSWVLNYLPVDRQRQFVAALDLLGAADDLSWVVAESPAETPGLPIPTGAPPDVLTVVSLVRWRNGARTVIRLGTAHPHGYWLCWD